MIRKIKIQCNCDVSLFVVSKQVAVYISALSFKFFNVHGTKRITLNFSERIRDTQMRSHLDQKSKKGRKTNIRKIRISLIFVYFRRIIIQDYSCWESYLQRENFNVLQMLVFHSFSQKHAAYPAFRLFIRRRINYSNLHRLNQVCRFKLD